jgi:adenylosuccinate synthase
VLSVVVGGQYGSEAKGTVVGWLAKQTKDPVVVRVGGPNAGHTVYDADGREWKLRAVPVGFVNPGADLVIAAGSEVDLRVLSAEVADLEAAGHKIQDRLFVDKEATALKQVHVDQEFEVGLNGRLGSTAKGVGAARAARLWRQADRFGDLDQGLVCPVDTVGGIRAALEEYRHVIVEGTQGYGLGLHAGQYPFCTSGDVRAIDFLSQVGISPWEQSIRIGGLQIWIVFRTRPIRVAGNSGDLLGETTWEQLQLPIEYTTVTKRERRVGEWDLDLAHRALEANGHPSPCTRVALMMLDQVFPEVAGQTALSTEALTWVTNKAEELGHPIDLVGTGPTTQISVF